MLDLYTTGANESGLPDLHRRITGLQPAALDCSAKARLRMVHSMGVGPIPLAWKANVLAVEHHECV